MADGPRPGGQRLAVSGWGIFGSQARDLYLNLKTRTRDPMAETWDPKMPSSATLIAPYAQYSILDTPALPPLPTGQLVNRSTNGPPSGPPASGQLINQCFGGSGRP